MLRALVVFGCLVACRPQPPRPPPAPHVRLIVEPASSPHALYETRAWSPLGFTVSFDDMALEECPRFWYAMHLTNCQITVLVQRDPGLLEIAHTEGLADRTHRAISIDASVTGDRLKISLAHELGHILLDTPTHTAGGIMGGSTWWMKPVDYELACTAIGICVTPK